ncbi:hypothetical protein A9Q77_05205 [Marinomonas sp. 42_23_T18]|nr:hypothetical protein A9Q77_05205 [Marinomonas sp. 42_23_T18]
MSESTISERASHYDAPLSPKKLSFEFRGKGFEYFKLWVVNALLSVMTLGIYSAWATVRNNRYLYANLYLNDSHFRYLANPIQILKGRIIAVTLLVIYNIVLLTMPIIGLVLAVFLIFSIPYFVNKSMAFNRRMTSYKNIQFRFNASYKQAFMVTLIWPLLGILTLGLLYPKALKEIYAYTANNSAYGKSKFHFCASTWDYGKPALFAAAIVLSLGLSVWGISEIWPSLQFIAPIIFVLTYFTLIVFFIVTVNNIFYQNLQLQKHHFTSNYTMAGLFKVILINTLLTLITLGFYLPAAKIRLLKYLAENVTLNVHGSLENFSAATPEDVSALGEEMGQSFEFGV